MTAIKIVKRDIANYHVEFAMAAPPGANAADVKKHFIEDALTSGALKAEVIEEKDGTWRCDSEFDDPSKPPRSRKY